MDININEETYERLIDMEAHRQDENIELIASENFPSERVLKAAGSILTNKYAEGYPGKRYYGGCQYIDMIEQKAINDVCKLFGCKFANVQPHCGSSANQAVYRAFLNSGDTVLGMDLGAGGHLTHGHKMSFSGQDYNIVSYGVTEDGIIDYEDIERKLSEYNPRLLIVGASSYSQIIDYKKIKSIVDKYNNEIIYKWTKYYDSTTDEERFERSVHLSGIYVGKTLKERIEEEICYLMVDMAHVAGLVAGGVHPNPVEYADVVTSTTHKTLRGPRGGIILWNNEEYTKRINSAVFPGIQGGPLEHIIAAKGICFEEAMTDKFKKYAKQVIDNAKIFADTLKNGGFKVVSNGTQNHMFVLDTYSSMQLTGKEVEVALDAINITLNKNQIPNDTLPPLKSSGVRIGTAAMTTKGWKEQDFVRLGKLMIDYLTEIKLDKMESDTFEETINDYKREVSKLVGEVKYRDKEMSEYD